jgi:hypothetical protein
MLLLANPMNTFPSTMETNNIVKNRAPSFPYPLISYGKSGGKSGGKISGRTMVSEAVLVLAVVKVPVGYVLHSFWVMYHT